MDMDIELTGEALNDLCSDLRDIRVTCSGATDELRHLLDQVPFGSGCTITIEGVDGEEEGPDDGD